MGMKKLKLLTAPLAALLLAGTACHTEQRQGKLPAPQGNAPAIRASAPAAPVSAPQTASDSKPTLPEPVQITPQPKPDPVADLIANAEKEYQAGEDRFKTGDLEAAKRNF